MGCSPLVVAGLAAALISTLAPASPSAAQAPRAPTISATAARGAQVAQLRCAGCHALARGESRSPMAPPFWVLRTRYNPLRLERHIQELAEQGYWAMPAQGGLTNDDALAVAAYIETLRPES